MSKPTLPRAGRELQNWAVCLPGDHLATAARLRGVAGVEVCSVNSEIWLRGPALDEALEHRLRGLPGARRFAVLPDGQLLAPAAWVPKGRIPQGPWVSLTLWLKVVLPVAGLAGKPPAGAPLQLVRATEPQPEAVRVLLTDWEDWSAFASRAAAVRLERLRFAVAEDGRVAVVGEPLPPISGERLTENDGIAVPAGWTWWPAVDAAVLGRLLELASGDLAILHAAEKVVGNHLPERPGGCFAQMVPDTFFLGSWERIAADDFVPGSRAAVRATAEESGRGSE